MPSCVSDVNGMQSQTQQIVNLHYTNVIDWLVSNGLAPDNGNYQAAQEYMDIDIQFAKSHFTEDKLVVVKSEVAALIKSEITYLDAKRIFEYLEQTEKDSTAGTVFTYFTSEMLRSWQTLLRSWEKSNLHLVHAANRLASLTGQEVPNLERKLLAAEKTVRTIDHRLIELQRASTSYDKAYADEYRAHKKKPKEYNERLNDERYESMYSTDIDNQFEEITTQLSSYELLACMDCVFAFVKFPEQGSQTAKNDYHCVYRCLRAVNAIPSAKPVKIDMTAENVITTAGSDTMSVTGSHLGSHPGSHSGSHMGSHTGSMMSHDKDILTLETLLHSEGFIQELVLELQGIKAFLNQKLSNLDGAGPRRVQEHGADHGSSNANAHASDSVLMPPPVRVPETSETIASSSSEVYDYVKTVETIILQLKKLRTVIKANGRRRMSSRQSSTSCSSVDLLGQLRQRAVKYRLFFEELKQNRSDIATSINRYKGELKKLHESSGRLKEWLEKELSRLTDATVTIIN